MVPRIDHYDFKPMERSDIAFIAQLFLDSTKSDLAFVSGYESDYKSFSTFENFLKTNAELGTFVHVKAVDRATGFIDGYACWFTPSGEAVAKEYEMYGHGEAPVGSRDSTENETYVLPEESRHILENFPDPNKPDNVTRDGGIYRYLELYATRWRARFQKGRRYIRLAALLVHPDRQRVGLGTRLVKYGFQFADAWNLRTLAVATCSSWPVMFRCGFEIKKALDIDLRNWIYGAAFGDKGYGNYTFRFVVREPIPFDPERAMAFRRAEAAVLQALTGPQTPTMPSVSSATLPSTPVPRTLLPQTPLPSTPLPSTPLSTTLLPSTPLFSTPSSSTRPSRRVFYNSPSGWFNDGNI